MKIVTLIGGALGASLTVWLLASFGFAKIIGLLEQAGWGVVLVIAFHLIQILFSALAWREIGGPQARRLSLWRFGVMRWIREAVNNLLPVAQVGGEFVAARLVNRAGLGLTLSAACTLCDLTTEMVTQILFTLTGLLTLLLLLGHSPVVDEVVSGLGGACLLGAVFVAAQWFGLADLLERGLGWAARQFGWQGTQGISGLNDVVMRLYRSPRGLSLALFNQSVSWGLGAVEVCLALHVLGHDVGLGAGLVIESLAQAVKSVSFAVPAALGVSEGGFVVLGSLFGLPPDVSIALALIKRLREIVLGLPALVVWQWFEHMRPRGDKAAEGGTVGGNASASERRRVLL